jgi:hypothetical protein
VNAVKARRDFRTTKTPVFTGGSLLLNWLRGLDLNQLPSGYEPKRETPQTGIKTLYLLIIINFYDSPIDFLERFWKD